ncbi:MAG: hypothetical protein WA082_05030 [Candidatus Moraniibacteriota bacterium]
MKASFRFLDPWFKRPAVIPLDQLPEEMKSLAREIGNQLSQEAALRYAYDVLLRRYHGYRMLTFLRLDRFLITDIDTLWQKQGFLHCNQTSYLLRTFLVASGKFVPEAIESKWTQIWFFSPHQYLVITLEGGKEVEVDLWGRAYGIPFGSHAHGFQSGSFFARIEE